MAVCNLGTSPYMPSGKPRGTNLGPSSRPKGLQDQLSAGCALALVFTLDIVCIGIMRCVDLGGGHRRGVQVCGATLNDWYREHKFASQIQTLGNTKF